MKNDIVYISPISWDFLWQRQQQLCVGFAHKGIRVLYVEPPVSILGLIKRPSKILKLIKKRIYYNRITVFTPITLLPLRFNILSKLNEKIIYISLRKKINSLHFSKPFFISCDPQVSGVISNFKENIICYDCCDEVTAFPHVPANIVEKELMQLRISDVVITTSKNLANSKKKINDNVYLIPNGVNIEHFITVDNIKDDMRPKELKDIKGPIIGYYGAIAPWMDFELISEVAKRHPEWSFVLIGLAMTKIPVLPGNCYIIPHQKYQDLPKFVKFFDICIIPFVRNELILNTNPVKLYEYLAAGKPIISTRMPEVEQYSSVVKIVDNSIEFEKAVIECLGEDMPDCKTKRREIASQNSWQTRCEKILEILDKQNKLS